ncbi:hypothetical protein QQ045_023721 [Rhodiola kirilowii]
MKSGFNPENNRGNSEPAMKATSHINTVNASMETARSRKMKERQRERMRENEKKNKVRQKMKTHNISCSSLCLIMNMVNMLASSKI